MSYHVPSRLRSFDEVLGPRASRYLADGHRRIERTIAGFRVESDASGPVITAVGRAVYPTDWSTKGAGETLVPHLSSIDALAFGEGVLEHAVSMLAGDTGRASPMHVTTATLRAGARAHLRLDEIPLQCTLSDGPTPGSVSARCRIGSLTLDLVADVVSPGSGFSRRDLAVAAPAGAPERTLDSDGVEWSSFFEPIEPGATALRAVHIADTDQLARSSPRMTAVDVLALSAQQAQLLIYGIGGVTRAAADTMWMRAARFVVPSRAVPGPALEMRLEIAASKTLRRGDQVWHVHEVLAEASNGASASASLAYRSQTPTG